MMRPPDPHQPALDAFLNAALREGRLRDARFGAGRLAFSDAAGRRVEVALRAASRFRCLFAAPILRTDGDRAATLDALTLLGDLAAEHGAAFRARVLDSARAIAAAPPARGRAGDWTFAQAEQALKAGHCHHPNPRSRDEMTEADARLYAPEQEGRFALTWFEADAGATLTNPGAAHLLDALALADLGRRSAPGRQLLPWHPWQADRLLARPDIAALASAGRLSVAGPGRAAWTATSSMRAVHAWHAPVMVKSALSLRLTNSTRHLSLREVARGVQVSALLAGPVGAAIAAAFPRLSILGEPGYAALTDGAAPIDAAIVALRDNPFRDPARPGPAVLAALCEARPDGPSALGATIARLGGDAEETAIRWFDRFLDIAILPLLEIRARWGLLFGSHQQNMMLSLEGGWPDRAWIRDCQGTGHLADFHDRLSALSPGIGEGTENVVPADLGDGLLTYYVVVANAFNVVATLTLDGLAREDRLLSAWRRALIRARSATPGDRTLYDRLLDAPVLTAKGNFATSVSGVNEASGGAGGQLAAFLDLPNPLAHLKEPA